MTDTPKLWRTGHTLRRTLYLGDEFRGMFDRPEDAKAVCEAMNTRPLGRPLHNWETTLIYRNGSVSDFATDIAYLLTRTQAVELVEELQRFMRSEPAKFKLDSGDALAPLAPPAPQSEPGRWLFEQVPRRRNPDETGLTWEMLSDEKREAWAKAQGECMAMGNDNRMREERDYYREKYLEAHRDRMRLVDELDVLKRRLAEVTAAKEKAEAALVECSTVALGFAPGPYPSVNDHVVTVRGRISALTNQREGFESELAAMTKVAEERRTDLLASDELSNNRGVRLRRAEQELESERAKRPDVKTWSGYSWRCVPCGASGARAEGVCVFFCLQCGSQHIEHSGSGDESAPVPPAAVPDGSPQHTYCAFVVTPGGCHGALRQKGTFTLCEEHWTHRDPPPDASGSEGGGVAGPAAQAAVVPALAAESTITRHVREDAQAADEEARQIGEKLDAANRAKAKAVADSMLDSPWTPIRCALCRSALVGAASNEPGVSYFYPCDCREIESLSEQAAGRESK